jgi:hypothetical protein
MKYTSLRSCKNGNYQTDYYGKRDEVVADFQRDCKGTDATWGYLFEQQTGGVVASYDVTAGVMEAA